MRAESVPFRTLNVQHSRGGTIRRTDRHKYRTTPMLRRSRNDNAAGGMYTVTGASGRPIHVVVIAVPRRHISMLDVVSLNHLTDCCVKLRHYRVIATPATVLFKQTVFW